VGAFAHVYVPYMYSICAFFFFVISPFSSFVCDTAEWSGAGRVRARICALYVPHGCLICPAYVPYMSRICALYVPHMCLICPAYVPYMSRICALYVPHMCLICPAHVPYMSRTCALYVPHMSQVMQRKGVGVDAFTRHNYARLSSQLLSFHPTEREGTGWDKGGALMRGSAVDYVGDLC